MKQTRIIRISFFICAALLVVGFWSGFYMGEHAAEPEQILTASGEKENNADNNPDTPSDPLNNESVSSKESTDEETVESMKDIKSRKYYIKEGDGYLTVYYSDSDRIYFETDLKLTDLPEELQEEAKTGIFFSDISEVYSFLENYSS